MSDAVFYTTLYIHLAWDQHMNALDQLLLLKTLLFPTQLEFWGNC